MARRTITVSDAPRWAPANFRELPAKVIIKDGDGLWETWHGSGVRCGHACGGCGATEGLLQIYGNWGHSYPNGNSWEDAEVLCPACGAFTVISDFTEG
ncbi:MAG: hypothetical protein H6713_36585 [Myxococcales bacterium]|nr:hypothetical protein [Myxococcales bacterium]